MSSTLPTTAASAPQLARRLGLFDATMIVMGGIVGAGIFINPYIVAQQVHTRALILGAWIFGGAIALAGSFIYAELASRMPAVGGQYAYLREAYHPAVAFVYGWSLLLVIQTGGMAAVAVTFGKYVVELTHSSLSPTLAAVFALGALTLINCFGVRAGSSVQSALMVLKIVVTAALVICGALFAGKASGESAAIVTSVAPNGAAETSVLIAFFTAMVPVLFSYGGYQTANFIAGEMREPRKDLPRGLVLGVCGVIILYVGVNFICVRALGPAGLAATTTPASAVMRLALGETGAKWIAAGIAISALGFLSQSILTAPRVYFAMASDGLFFRAVARLSPGSRVPVVAITLQGLWAIVIALSGRYEQILNFFIAMDVLFIGLSATCVFVFRRRESNALSSQIAGVDETENHSASEIRRIPGHPFTSLGFVAACWLVVAATFYRYPHDSLIGLAIALVGLPVYYFWSASSRRKMSAAK